MARTAQLQQRLTAISTEHGPQGAVRGRSRGAVVHAQHTTQQLKVPLAGGARQGRCLVPHGTAPSPLGGALGRWQGGALG